MITNIKKQKIIKRVITFLLIMIALCYLPFYLSLIVIFIYSLFFTSPYEILLLGLMLDSTKILGGESYNFYLPTTIITGGIIILINLIKPRIRTNEILET